MKNNDEYIQITCQKTKATIFSDNDFYNKFNGCDLSEDRLQNSKR